jgi:hypothetical protein
MNPKESDMEFNELKLYEIEVTLFWKDGPETREIWGYRWNRGQTRVLPFVKEPFPSPERITFSPGESPLLRRIVERGDETGGADWGAASWVHAREQLEWSPLGKPPTPYVDEFDKDEWEGCDTASDKFYWRCGHVKTDEGLEIFWRCARGEDRPFSGAAVNAEKWKDADGDTLKRLGYYW